jgi:hypothetical protein
MSAFILSDLHFAAIAYNVAPDQPQEFADRLKRININSVNFRYAEKTRFAKVKLPPAETVEYSSADLVSLISCWQYQACENGLDLDYLLMDAYLETHKQAFKEDTDKYSSIWTI